MGIVIILMVVGIVFGFFLRPLHITWFPKLLQYIVCLLLFTLGMAVGSNEVVISSLSSLGIEALILAVSAVLGSVLLVKIIGRWCSESNKNEE